MRYFSGVYCQIANVFFLNLEENFFDPYSMSCEQVHRDGTGMPTVELPAAESPERTENVTKIGTLKRRCQFFHDPL